MPAEAIPGIMTAEELERVNLPGKSTELIRGRLVVREPPGTYHGRIAARLLYRLGEFVYPNDLGELFGQDTGFKIESNPDSVRAPDVAFLSHTRADQIKRRGYAQVTPDLVAEILSPDDAPAAVLAKVGDWLNAGVRLVWVIDPDRSEARIHRANGSLAIVAHDGALDGEDDLPGFSCALSQLLEPRPDC
jgi:Uma2 family endonuclease